MTLVMTFVWVLVIAVSLAWLVVRIRSRTFLNGWPWRLRTDRQDPTERGATP